MCENPRTIWLRRSYPLGLTDEQITEYNKPKMAYQKGYYAIEVPCGNCIQCRLSHASDWATRCFCEFETWKTGCFITLTYNNPHLPMTKTGKTTLVKKHTQQFFKNLRKHEKGFNYWTNPVTHKYENPIRFMGAGEYGTKGTRAIIGGNPHYHFCVFNWKPSDLKYYDTTERGDILYTSQTLQKHWEDKQQKEGHKTRGLVIVGELNYKSASYVARYVQKKAGIEPKRREYEIVEDYDRITGEIKYKRKIVKKPLEREEEFINASRCPGIGRGYWEQNKQKIKENKGIWINNGKAKLKEIPRYFKKLWNNENWLEFERFKYQHSKEIDSEITRQLNELNMPNKNLFEKRLIFIKMQAKILKDKAELLKRNI